MNIKEYSNHSLSNAMPLQLINNFTPFSVLFSFKTKRLVG